jgi:hypothetical protein
MKESVRKSAAVVLLPLALAGCSPGRWFESDRPSGANGTPSLNTSRTGDPKAASAAYIRSLCALPREQRQPQMRALNEALLPDNVLISCGRSGMDTE